MEAVSKNLLKIKILQYRSNVSWQSLKTRTTRLDPQSSKLENFEYQVLSRVPQVSSQVVWVSSRSDKKFIARLILYVSILLVYFWRQRNFQVATPEAEGKSTFVIQLA